ncbi:uncharacterized protein [Typha latifolia]|uniref:uncharacterized protein isoform X1 n=1 Tax=Typha latifolia TaxID=4733 RepID=UPI003C2E73C1
MRAVVLIRSGSFHAWTELAVRSGPESGSGSLPFLRRSPSVRLSPRSFALHVGPKENGNISSSLLLRARSEADLVTRTYRPARVAEEEEEYSNGGMGKGTKVGGGGGRSGEGGDHNNRRIGDYYQEMLRSDPGNPLLLRNYGQFLHEEEAFRLREMRRKRRNSTGERYWRAQEMEKCSPCTGGWFGRRRGKRRERRATSREPWKHRRKTAMCWGRMRASSGTRRTRRRTRHLRRWLRRFDVMNGDETVGTVMYMC